MAFFLETLFGGLMAGMLYSLIALGFVLIFKASGVFNFAQGAMVLVAALAMARFAEWIPEWLDFDNKLLANVIAFALATVFMFLLAWLIEKLVLRHLVNQEGVRFTDEAPGTVDAVYESITRKIFNQTNGIAYTLLDQKINDVPNYRLGLRSDQPPITGANWAELASRLKVPAEALTQTVQAYNAACTGGEFKALELDHLATRGLTPPKSHWARTLDKPPFMAYPVISSNVLTFGGLKVNTRAQVLDLDGAVIPGLYAAGEVVGLYYKTYTGATSVLKGAVFGRLAGLDAARA